MKNIRTYIIALSVALSTSGCLEKLPDDAVLDYEAIYTLSDAEQAVTGIYSGFKAEPLYSGYLTLLPDIQCDMVYMVEGSGNNYGEFWRWEVLASTPHIEGVYASLYSIIGRCNFFFAYVERVRRSLTDDEQLDALQELEGDVYFARALAYSELVKMYCKAYDPATAENELGVVLVSSYYNPGVPVRANLRDSYQFILDDLAKAEEYVVRDPGGYVSYFTPTVVDALYARVYLYMQDWSKANEYATRVIEGREDKAPTHSLASVNTNLNTSSGVMSQYEVVWKYDQGSEIIWRVGFTLTSMGGALGRFFLNYNQRDYRPDYVPANAVLNSYAAQDMRPVSFFAEGLPIGYDYQLITPLLVKYRGNQDFIDAIRRYHVSMPKPFRISEQYLIRAEARCRMAEAGIEGMSYAQAAQDIATLRAARYSGGSGAALSADNWLDEISKERVKELFMEGFRLHDLKRWNMGFERTPQSFTLTDGSSLKVEAGDPRFVWPIPQHEIDSPGSQIVQN